MSRVCEGMVDDDGCDDGTLAEYNRKCLSFSCFASLSPSLSALAVSQPRKPGLMHATNDEVIGSCVRSAAMW